MTGTGAEPRSPTAMAAWVGPVVAILVLQTIAAFLTRVMPTVGPALLVDIGSAESAVGYLVAATQAGSMLVLLFGMHAVRTAGSIRAMQIALGLGAASFALMIHPALATAVAASVALGLGHGVATPAGSDVLQRFTPPNRRNLLFSIKQAGVPLGGVIAGVTLPWVVDGAGWRTALVATAVCVIVCVLLVMPLRRHADRPADGPAEPPAAMRPSIAALLAQPIRSLASLSSERTLWRLSWAGALLATAQSCWIAFSVTYLTSKVGLSLTTAGMIFAIMQATGVAGRIGLGWLSDLQKSGLPVMRGAALASALTMVLLAMTSASWPLWSLILLAAAGGISASGWNGVQIAEIAHRSPIHLVRETATGSTILIFISNILAPILFTAFVSATDRFDIAFYAVAAVSLASLTCLFVPDADP